MVAHKAELGTLGGSQQSQDRVPHRVTHEVIQRVARMTQCRSRKITAPTRSGHTPTTAVSTKCTPLRGRGSPTLSQSERVLTCHTTSAQTIQNRRIVTNNLFPARLNACWRRWAAVVSSTAPTIATPAITP